MFKSLASRTLLTGTAVLALTGAAFAMPAVGLAGDRTLYWFDTETLEVTGTVEVQGVDMLHGIDVRPADGLLYGVGSDGAVVTIDVETGETTAVSTLSENLPDGVAAIVDFNPAADRLRFMGEDGTNLRANVDDGSVTVDGNLAYAEGDMNAGATPNVVAAAYTNSFGMPEETAMYDIDGTLGILVQQAPPNDGVLNSIGELGVEGTGNFAFDIATTAELENTAYLIVGSTLHTVDLESGAATEIGAIEGLDAELRDLAILQ